jgi:hypothetical protein
MFMVNMAPPVYGATTPGVMAELKADVRQDDVDEAMSSSRKSNVLFMIESTAAMSFSPKGVLPQVMLTSGWDDSYVEPADWNKTKAMLGYTVEDINRMMADATFGMGALPPAWSGKNLRPERNLYGRDIDASNNFIPTGKGVSADIEANKDRYYFPHVEAVNAINNDSYKHSAGKKIYESQTLGLEVGFENAPDIWPYAVGPAMKLHDFRAGHERGNDKYHSWDGPITKDVYFYKGNKPNGWKGYYKSLQLNPQTGAIIGSVSGNTVHSVGLGDQVVADYAYNGNTPQNTAFPYAMVFKDPQYWQAPPSSVNDSLLVPNDSRMYQTKLVLWRILQNRDIFKNMRIGLASTFLSPANPDYEPFRQTRRGSDTYRTDYNGIFKVVPYGSNAYTIHFFDNNLNAYINTTEKSLTFSRLGKVDNPNIGQKVLSDMIEVDSKKADYGKWKPGFKRIRWRNGLLQAPMTGEMETYTWLHGQYYPLWQASKVMSFYDVPKKRPVQNAYIDVAIQEEERGWWSWGWSESGAKDAALAGENRDRPLYKLLNRGSLWVPVLDYDYVWTKGSYSMTQADKIRMWIDGVADIRSSGEVYTNNGANLGINNHKGFGDTRKGQFHYYRNPELGVAGTFALPQAIYPDPRKFHPLKTSMELELDRDFYYGYGSKYDGGKDLGRKRQNTAESANFDSNKNHFIWFSKANADINYRADYRRYSQEFDLPGVPRALFNAGSGEAAGSVIDFFSPKFKFEFTGKNNTNMNTDHESHDAHNIDGVQIKDSDGKNAVKMEDLADVSFPIKNACENNWLIVIASGTEARNPGGYTYQSWQAVDNLYKATDKKNKGVTFPGHRGPIYDPVTIISKGTPRTFSQVDLDEPIRTLVVGIVANPNDPSIKNDPVMAAQVKEMRLNLTKAAMAGQGRGAEAANLTVANMHLAPVQPFFADDVESLMRGVSDALSFIESHAEQPAKGAMLEASALSDKLTSQGSNDREFDYYVANFLVRKDRQWDGLLSRYQVVEDSSGVLRARKKWELSERIAAQRPSSTTNDWRALRYWKGGSLVNLARGADFAAMTGLSSANMYGVTGFIAADSPLPHHSASDSMYDWLQGYDYSYLTQTSGAKLPRKSLLNDIGQGGVAFVDDPFPSAALPGYLEWAKDAAAAPQDAMIYAQTNGGLLHVVEPVSGNEEMAILPPPSLIPARLATLKTNRRGAPLTGDVTLQWVNVRVKEADIRDGDITAQRGNPVYMLDGSLQKRFFANTQTGFSDAANTIPSWSRYLLGTLGRGGSGLYMMDVDTIKSPKLLWYRERVGTKIMMEAAGSGTNQSPVVKPAEADDKYFLKLGFNSPQPVMGVAGSSDKMINFVAVTGGAQYNVNLADNGKEGAVLMMLNPKTGDVIKAFDSDSLSASSLKSGGGVAGAAPYMGMMVTEPTLYSSEADTAYGAYLTGHMFTADNRGNIFHVAMEGPDANGNIAPFSPSQWRIRTLATLQARASASTSSKSYAAPFGLVADRVGRTMWLAGGTSNVPVRKQSGGDGYITNGIQTLFAFATQPDSQSGVYTMDDLHMLKATTDNDPPYDSTRYHGWMIPLSQEIRSQSGRVIKYAEYVSAKPMLSGGVLFIPTFIPNGFTDDELKDPTLYCQGGLRTRGSARLYAIRLTDGTRWAGFKYSASSGTAKYIEIANAKITGLSTSNRGSVTRGIVTIDKLSDAYKADTNLSTVIDNKNDALLSFVAPLPPGGVNMEPGQNIIKYWITR